MNLRIKTFSKGFHILLWLISLSSFTYGQDGAFSQYFTNPIFLNPAFVGSSEGTRISMGHRIQWPYIPGQFSTTGIGVGYQPDELMDGVGTIVKRNVEGEGNLTTTNVMGLFSRRWVIPQTMDIQAGMQVGAIHRRINWNKMVFSDQLDPVLGNVRASQANKPNNLSATAFDVSAGIITKFDFPFKKGIALNQAGLAVYHVNQPSTSFTGAKANYPRRWVAHYGVLLPFNGVQTGKTLSIYPNARFEKQRDFTQLDLSAVAFEDPLFFGASFRNGKDYFNPENTSQLIVTGGVRSQNKALGRFMIGYSYDVSLTGMRQVNRGSHEISLMFFFQKKDPQDANRNPSFGCSKFYDKGLSPIF